MALCMYKRIGVEGIRYFIFAVVVRMYCFGVSVVIMLTVIADHATCMYVGFLPTTTPTQEREKEYDLVVPNRDIQYYYCGPFH